MKTTKTGFQSIPLMICKTFIVLCLLLPAISCKKDASAPTSVSNMQSIANSLKGEVLIGSLSTESDNDGMGLWYNGTNILIGMGRITPQGMADPGVIKHAEIVYSDFGIVLRDTDTDKYWYYIQNDAESKSKFEWLHNAGQHPIVSTINGTIKIKFS
jgi:hypothetical protein